MPHRKILTEKEEQNKEAFLQVYKLHLINNEHLPDRSEEFTYQELVNFVKNEMSEADRDWYGCPEIED